MFYFLQANEPIQKKKQSFPNVVKSNSLSFVNKV